MRQRFDGQRRRSESRPGSAVITSRAVRSWMFGVAAIFRRRSPSVMMPASRPSFSTTRRHAEALARHLVDHVAHRGVQLHDRQRIARAHQLLDAHQPLAELAARDAGWRSPRA